MKTQGTINSKTKEMKAIEFFKKSLIIAAVLLVATALSCGSFEKRSTLKPEQTPLIIAPNDPIEWPAFRESLRQWKKETKKSINYDDKLYNRADFEWVTSAYNCCFLMMYDETFYDHANNRYRVDEFIDEGIKRFGGYDIVVLWHAYPRIGLDERNQFDFYRDMPGGLESLRKISDQFHKRGVKVFINYNPWDTGTRRENVSDIEALAAMVEALDADGIFLDTMNKGAEEFRTALDRVREGVVLESELALPVESIYSHHASWGQWFEDGYTPGILRNKWIEPRHVQHAINRWVRDKSKELHTAWMNGSGIMIWENIFGQWIGWSDRDAYLLKTITSIQRRFTRLFSHGEWTPLVDENPFPGIFASLWEDENNKLWTLVNRQGESVEGELLHINIDNSYVYFDLITGREIVPDPIRKTLSGKIISRGIGCFYACKKNLMPDDLQAFLHAQSELFNEVTSNTSAIVPVMKLKPVRATPPYGKPPVGMVSVPAMKGTMETVFNCRETGYYKSIEDEYISVGMPRGHSPETLVKEVDIRPFAIDETPVTNAQFKKFLDISGYRPYIAVNFLKHWIGGEIPEGKEEHPVVYVSLEDARAYAAWAGKRLPREEEWQLAAAGTEGNIYPWGNTLLQDVCNTNTDGTTTPVKAFPKGVSVYGVWDMCGNTWELTESEYSNGRVRFCILKGGCCYHAIGSDWYFDGGFQRADFAAKQLLVYPGIDRCSTIGFRCVVEK